MPHSKDERPRIGFTRGAPAQWNADGRYARKWTRVLIAAGAAPVPLPEELTDSAAKTLAELDGLLLTGGDDVDLRLWPHRLTASDAEAERLMEEHHVLPEPVRDRTELQLTQRAVEQDFPVLGVCRGCQVLHVALGGHLILNIQAAYPEALTHSAHPEGEKSSSQHHVAVEADTRLGRALARVADTRVNSRHRQAVLPNGAGETVIVAVSPEDGIVEAVEVPGRRWALGVQWHPELYDDPNMGDRHQVIFTAFVAACRGE